MHKHNNALNVVLLFFSSLFLFLIIILGSFSVIVYDKGFFYSEYAKNKIYDKLSNNKDYAIGYASNVTDNLINFLKGRDDLRYFNADEQAHMQDVKIIISALNFTYYTSALFFIILFIMAYYYYKSSKGRFLSFISRILIYGSIAAFCFLAVIFLWSVFSFESLFFLMHLVLFPQGNWTFPMDSLLITLFPEQFFFDISLRIFIYAIFQSVVFLIIGIWLRKQIKLSRIFGK